MEVLELKAQVRKGSGKGASRKLRASGSIPAVLYGSGSDSTSLSVRSADLVDLLQAEKGEAGFIKLIIEGEGKELEKLSMIKELQTNPVTHMLVHADFYEIRMDHKLTMDIPVHLIGQPIGVKMGGEIHQFKRDLKVSCLPSAMPKSFELDISELDIGSTLRVADVKLEKGVEILDSEDAQIISVVAKRAVEEEKPVEEAEAAPAEPEVITEKKSAKEKEEEK
ncbi:MAG TPA: 50S ribosomal protein L25/general stress protein Ctc [Syntrophales bacterium]|nr:50S ribosomal protein L25/general stress protein Ctc [Syntrophales bacterium]HOX95315.1 50S ribosomal protein L25/general stress protein Ctc [Syntrophales bacterium]HPI58105.1 50S ribosomal protein L25/general stress protein Ctc [Syntrophales bacterium]HPN24640.1 50S ribosomal protein L25/general stress protein Ctc [Syntrophales bacterium]HQM28945.1 50S ribosomal protein L25/general stress protein Ctc [Syntrophales bacterium]